MVTTFTRLLPRFLLRTPQRQLRNLHITFLSPNGQSTVTSVAEGDNVLDVALDHKVGIEGACGGAAECSTCHVIVRDRAIFERLPPMEVEEEDMLDGAMGVEEMSRLACQIYVRRNLDGMVLRLPAVTKDLRGM